MDHAITNHTVLTFGKPIMGIDAPIIDIEDVDSFVGHEVSLVAITLEMEKQNTNVQSWCIYTSDIIYIDDLVQNCSNSIANALELLQSCTKPLIWKWLIQILIYTILLLRNMMASWH